tara:strand:+ start:502 stop:996 length:495 start_codon:yes stop_codon:yes gene_type:complete
MNIAYKLHRGIQYQALPAVIGLLTIFGCAALNAANTVDTHPNPNLAPDEVVRIQLQSLRANGPLDDGIEVCFRFASPLNQANTGPVDRFSRMIKEGIYALMLSYESAEYEPVQIVDRFARQQVTLVGYDQIVTYVFYLSRQRHGSCRDCWMTDSVDVLAVHEAT